MLNRYARGLMTWVFTPLARLLQRLGVTPDGVTIFGTIGACLAALILFPLGQLFWGTIIFAAFVFSDLVDGILSRLPNPDGTPRERTAGQKAWGAFLDSTLDRVVDFCLFGALGFWFLTGGDRPDIGALCMASMGLGAVVSYSRAKADSLGVDANVGIAERGERMVLVLFGSGLNGLGLTPWVLFVILCVLVVGSIVTIIQRSSAMFAGSHAKA